MRFLALSFLVVFSCFSAPAFAQPMQNQTPSAQEDPLDDIPEEFIAEAAAYYRECTTNTTLQNFYDCKCMASTYLDFRIELGPSAAKSNILTRLMSECRDYTQITGQEYSECLLKTHKLPVGTDPEAYCECYVNTYISMLERRNPVIRSANLAPLKTRSAVSCQSQNLQR